ncbi:MAG: urocanate hydratase [Candidatus Thermoplasmatota archaeon]|nr:urocanate hydratase [Candidatus Thermoplasmatota archaeon]
MARVQAARGTKLRARGWRQEALLRMMENTLENAERPDDLIIYGGTGRVARSWDAYEAMHRLLQELQEDETLLVQSGKPVGVFRTHTRAPRVLIANTNLVPHWATWDHFRELEALGLMMFGQMTAGSWAYIGTQGIIQGTYETFAASARQDFDGSLEGRTILTGGLGGMGGAQPLAVTMNGGACLAVEVDEGRARRRLDAGFCDEMTHDLGEALAIVENARDAKEPASVALIGNCAEVHPELVRRGFHPDVVTDQTSAHDALEGYIPAGLSLEEAASVRRSEPEEYLRRSRHSIVDHVKAMLAFQDSGSVVFEYGNNIRGQARDAGLEGAFGFEGFVKLYIRPMFTEGRGPFRWVAISGNPEDILRTDEVVLKLFPENLQLTRWIRLAEKHLPWEGLPARVCWLGFGERARFAGRINAMVRAGDLEAPIVITRDHLDSGSVASPTRETEGMRDGSDAVADWPLLNALLNTASGADLVAIHSGGGVGVGYSVHAGVTVVAEGSEEADWRIERVFTSDPGLGVLRHADAGYEAARGFARAHGLRVPMEERREE